jgi:arginine utilization regulatory protein
MDTLLNTIEQGIIILDKHYKITYLNNYAEKILNTKLNENLHIPELNFISKNNTITYNNKTLRVKWQMLKLEQEEVYMGYLTDITDCENKDAKISCLEKIIDNVNEGIIASDKEGKIFIYNKALEELECLYRKDVLGKRIIDIYRVTSKSSELHTVLKTKNPLLGVNERFFTNKGQEINLICDNFPIYKNDKVVGAYGICRNVTKIRKLLNTTIALQQEINSSTRKNIKINKSSVKYNFNDIIGTSRLLKKAIVEAKKAAENDSSVLIVGDTGTGKELFVQSIHENSSRNKEPFIPINCAAIPESLLESLLFGSVKGAFTGAVDNSGLFQQAGNGTLFLDELNSMDINLQSKLLRVLQEKVVRKVGGKKEIPVNCRIISTTNKDPLKCITEGTLRRDLFYRLAVITIYIPPLVERKEDIEPLIKYFIEIYNKKYNTNVTSISSQLIDIFNKYNWPGNVRELQNLIEGAINMVENENIIRLEHLPSYFFNQFSENNSRYAISLYSQSHNLSQILLQIEERLILQALSNYKGNITKAADSLGIARQNLHYKIRKMNIDIGKFKK